MLLEKKIKNFPFNLYNFSLQTFFNLFLDRLPIQNISKIRFNYVCIIFVLSKCFSPPVQNISKIISNYVCTIFVLSKCFSVCFDFNILFLDHPPVQTISKFRFNSVFTFFFQLQMCLFLFQYFFKLKKKNV